MGMKNKLMQRKTSCNRKIASETKTPVKSRLKSVPRFLPTKMKTMPMIFATTPTEDIESDAYPLIINSNVSNASPGVSTSSESLSPLPFKLERRSDVIDEISLLIPMDMFLNRVSGSLNSTSAEAVLY